MINWSRLGWATISAIQDRNPIYGGFVKEEHERPLVLRGPWVMVSCRLLTESRRFRVYEGL